MKPAKLDEIVRVMKGVGEVIVPFNFPKVPFNPEDELSIFKSRYATVDGYQIFMHYQKSDVLFFEVIGWIEFIFDGIPLRNIDS